VGIGTRLQEEHFERANRGVRSCHLGGEGHEYVVVAGDGGEVIRLLRSLATTVLAPNVRFPRRVESHLEVPEIAICLSDMRLWLGQPDRRRARHADLNLWILPTDRDAELRARLHDS